MKTIDIEKESDVLLGELKISRSYGKPIVSKFLAGFASRVYDYTALSLVNALEVSNSKESAEAYLIEQGLNPQELVDKFFEKFPQLKKDFSITFSGEQIINGEAILLCECGHLRSDHYDNDSPCYGGSSDGVKPTEGWCQCGGFVSEDPIEVTNG